MTKKQSRSKPASTLDSGYQEEIQKAALRVGEKTDLNIAWLFRFCEMDLATLSQGALLDLGYELNYLGDFRFFSIPTDKMSEPTAFSMHDWDGNMRMYGLMDEHHLSRALFENIKVRPRMKHPSLAQMKQLQEFIYGHIVNLVRWKCFALDLPQLSVHFRPTKMRDAVRIVRVANSPQDLCRHNFIYLLASGVGRIRCCPECEGVFFADRTNKVSCSSKCQNTAAVRRIRQKVKSSKRTTEKKSIQRKSKIGGA